MRATNPCGRPPGFPEGTALDVSPGSRLRTGNLHGAAVYQSPSIHAVDVLTIRETKFYKSRLVPIGDSDSVHSGPRDGDSDAAMGFDSSHLLTMRLNLPLAKYPQREPRIAVYQRLEERLRGVRRRDETKSVWFT